MEPRYVVGIDLGTTHSVVARAPMGPGESTEAEVEEWPIVQLVGPGEIQAEPLLPSFLLLPGPHDLPEDALSLPWAKDADDVVGVFARERGSEIPARLVGSAKSWLCHRGVDRTQPVLPWGAPADTRRVSPLDASARYLEHIRDAWNYEMAEGDLGARLEDQEIYLTIPASFDAVARELTVEAARRAGLPGVTLLEEPQAAFYAWLHAQKDGWRDLVSVGESILVCDVGGGTTDFSLIEVVDAEGELDLRRAAVGDHILLGGDNMDLTLAYLVRSKLLAEGVQLDDWQFRSLWYACRKAKERLLDDPELHSEPVVILGRGTSLIGGTIRTELTREEIVETLLEGFFPIVELQEAPRTQPTAGIREMGLPFASEPAITRHLASFLRRHVKSEGGEAVAFPSAVLFNGGVLKSKTLRERIVQALGAWGGGADLRELPSVDLDLAVAIGAAYFGLARRGRGVRIRAGASRSYYVGIESAMPAVPGVPTPMKALCVVPFGMEEGTEQDIRGKEFGLVVGGEAAFHFLASTARTSDAAGEEIDDWKGELQEVATLHASLEPGEGEAGGAVVPVWIRSKFTPVGTLELWCVSSENGRQWKLELDLREGSDAGGR